MKVGVTKRDKDASAELAVALDMSAETFTSGAADVIVQAFAQHREASQAELFEYVEGSAMNGCATAIALIAKVRAEE